MSNILSAIGQPVHLPSFTIWVSALLLLSACIVPYKPSTNKLVEKPSGKMLQGKYAWRGSARSGENVSLWLGTPGMNQTDFYLETGFYGDDGGKTHVYEGIYTRHNNHLILQVATETTREWDESISYEKTGKKSVTFKIKATIIPYKTAPAIELRQKGRTYLLLKQE